jgi:hypothetical protein
MAQACGSADMHITVPEEQPVFIPFLYIDSAVLNQMKEVTLITVVLQASRANDSGGQLFLFRG